MRDRDVDLILSRLALIEAKQELFAVLHTSMIQANRRILMALQQEIDRLSANVEGLNTEVGSMLAYLDNLAALLAENADDADEVRAIADRIQATKEQIVARLVANTPSEPAAPPVPPDAPVIE